MTAGEYAAFLNAKAHADPYGLYNANMASTAYGSGIMRNGCDGAYTYTVAPAFVNRPVNFISYSDAARFCNWLQNGQGDGDTESGAYSFDGSGGSFGRNGLRKGNATWWIPSESEWYKAAYYDPNKPGGQTGNSWEWMDVKALDRGLHVGPICDSPSGTYRSSAGVQLNTTTIENDNVGFRVATVYSAAFVVPEPASLAIWAVLGAIGCLCLKRKVF